MNRPLTSDDSSLASNESNDELQSHSPTFGQDWPERRKNLTLVKAEDSSAASVEDDELQSYISTFVRNWEERQERLTLNQTAIKQAEREWQAEQERERKEARAKHLSERPIS